MNKLKLLLLPVLGIIPMSLAAPFTLSWWTIDSGGGTSQGGPYRVSGTIGQPESGTISQGGNYTLRPGFWQQFSVIQVAGLPELKIRRAGPSNVVLTWTENSLPLVVQQSPNLTPATWITTGHQIFSNGNDRQIVIPGATGRTFFRLKTQ